MAPRWLTIVANFGDHLPFYRQAEIFKRQGIDLDRGTLGNWVGRACFHLMPVINQMRAHLRRADRIFVPSRQIASQSLAGQRMRPARRCWTRGAEGHQERLLLGRSVR